MLKKILLFLVFMAVAVFGQAGKVNIADTIDVVVNQRFKVPGDRQVVFTNVTGLNSTKAELLDANFNKISDLTDEQYFPRTISAKKGRGVMFRYEVFGIVKEAKNYYVKVSLSLKDERKRTKNMTGYYMVKAHNPTMAQEVKVRDTYYPTEKVNFSFATSEYTDPTKYSYHIEDGAGDVVDSGRGAIVVLEDLLKDDNNVGQSFTIVGKYNDKEFEYKDFGTGELKTTRWGFALNSPSLGFFSSWHQIEKGSNSQEGQQYYISPLNPELLKFYFVYSGDAGDGNLVVVPVKVRGLTITAEPAEFLSGNGGTAIVAGNFGQVVLTLNQEFLDNMEFCDDRYVKLTMTFNTQYDRNITYTFDATIIK